jgi:hypothetical protein
VLRQGVDNVFAHLVGNGDQQRIDVLRLLDDFVRGHLMIVCILVNVVGSVGALFDGLRQTAGDEKAFLHE